MLNNVYSWVVTAVAIISIALAGYFYGQSSAVRIAEQAFEKTLKTQTELNTRMVDSLASCNKQVTNDVKGNQRNKGKR